ncbi:shikimate kinase [Lysobacter daejeonensis GH1-9]|uniref:Shikimate kinase n=1 Tax=Lysobacter daejeonensis GH1-9 TaxID=1385517 RepID=A0A0A0EWC1_9GAMM|nr:shikimate kinase [Lysobacter daejeonensis]KGM54560.1 shikimate kinase [Lysobacter daejeonensis GH1-9]
MKPAANLVLVGPMGAGKTTLGHALAERLGLHLHDLDRAVELAAGASVADLFAREGEAGFRTREKAKLAELLAGDGALVATGGGAVLDADNRRILRARGFVVYLPVDVATQLARLAGDHTRPLLARPDREQVLQDLAALRTPLYREVADLVFDTTGLAAEDAAAQLADRLATQWMRQGATA